MRQDWLVYGPFQRRRVNPAQVNQMAQSKKLIALDPNSPVTYPLQQITDARYQCPKCGYAYITSDAKQCPSCDILIIEDIAAKHYNIPFSLGSRPKKGSYWAPKYSDDKYVNRFKIPTLLNLTNMETKEAFAYIEANWLSITEQKDGTGEVINYMTPTKEAKKQVYNIRIESPFILTPRQIKEKMGIGFNVVSVETERDIYTPVIRDIDSAVSSIIHTGYRALARANHPDLGGDPEVMMTLNRAKKELLDLLESLK